MYRALVLAALCSLSGNVAAAPPRTLTLAIGAEPDEGFDPLLGWSHGSNLLLQGTLLQQAPDLSWQPLLAESVSRSQDGLAWRVTLKAGLRFSDGSPLGAEDVAFTYNRAAREGGKLDMGHFVAARAEDARHLTLTLSAPQSTFNQVLGSLGIVSAKAYDPRRYARHPVSAGPYRLVSFQPGQQLVVEANPYYAGLANDFGRLVFLFLDEEAAVAAAMAGQADLVRVSPNQVGRVPAGLTLLERPSVENRGIMFPVVRAGRRDGQGYPVGNDVSADVSVRRAINLALDRALLAEQLFDGHATPAYSAVEGLPWQGEGSRFKDGDLEGAKALLDQAGWRVGQDGIRVKGDVRAALTLWYASGDTSRRDLALALRALLAPLGIELQLQSGSWERVEREMHANPVLFGWGSLDPSELLHHYGSRARGVGYYNPGYYANAAVDRHLAQALAASDPASAERHWQQVEWDGAEGAGFRGDAAWAWLLNIRHTYLANPCLDLGKTQPESHGSWSLLSNLPAWRWTCR